MSGLRLIDSALVFPSTIRSWPDSKFSLIKVRCVSTVLKQSWIYSLKSSEAEIGEAILKASEETGLPMVLIAALILQESSGRPLAMRHEPDFYRRYLRGRLREELRGKWPHHAVVSDTTERFLRSTSFGLMQIMGQKAREEGFNGDYLAELLDVDLNVRLGSLILKKNIDKFGESGGLLRYNGGGIPNYPQRVLKRIESGEAMGYLSRIGLVV